MQEVIRVVSDAGTGMKIALFPESLPRWKSELINLQESEPLPFWKAIDRIVATASLQQDLELHGVSSRQPADPRAVRTGSHVPFSRFPITVHSESVSSGWSFNVP